MNQTTSQHRLDAQWMQKALSLAQAYTGQTAPNPTVGCVIVNSEQHVIGQGAHPRAGEPHAEVFALTQAGKHAAGATLYVSLEPCNHHGKTPPCTEAIIAAGIARVVVGCQDPNPKVAGKGIARLQAAGIAVDVGIEQSAAEELISDFHIWLTQQRPYVIYKAALSWDGATASNLNKQIHISGEASQLRVHQLRSKVDAVIVGQRTFLVDNPDLRPRLIDTAILPWRIACLRDLPEPAQQNFLHYPQRAWLIAQTDTHAAAKAWQTAGVRVDIINQPLTIPVLMQLLWQAGIYRLLLEGGARFAYSFWQAGCIDWLTLIYGPKLCLDQPPHGLFVSQTHPKETPWVDFHPRKIEPVGQDWWVEGPLVKTV